MPGKISEMPAAATLTGTEPFETVQGGATKAGTINQIRDYSSLSPLIVNSVGAGSDSEIRLAINGAGKAAFYCVAASNLTWLYSRAMSAVNGIWYHATGGLAWGSPTGGDKGAGTINAQAVYDDNALLSCYVLEAFLDGSIDVGAWDARVPDRETPETRITESVRVTTEAVVLEPAPEGFVAVVRNVERDATEPQPVFDEAGNRLGEVEVPITREVVTPASVEERRHEPARRFAESRMDELEPAAFAGKWMATGVLPGFPTPKEWAAAPLSIGGVVQRLWELCELQAVHIAKLDERLAQLEAKA